MGNQPITALPWLLFLAPIYGGAVLLIREFARRHNKGWPTIILLGVAFSLLFEGIVDQMFYNPSYLDLASFEGYALIPGLGASGSLIQASLMTHTIWSVCVPIMLIEALDSQPLRPWLGRMGISFVTIVFLLGSILGTAVQYEEFDFFISLLQLMLTGGVVLLVCIVAFRIEKMKRVRGTNIPSTRQLSVWSFAALSIYWMQSWFLVGTNEFLAWISILVWLMIVTFLTVRLIRWTRSEAWTDLHSFALITGAVLCYCWTGFIQGFFRFGLSPIVIFGNFIFAGCTIWLLIIASQKLRERASRPGSLAQN